MSNKKNVDGRYRYIGLFLAIFCSFIGCIKVAQVGDLVGFIRYRDSLEHLYARTRAWIQLNGHLPVSSDGYVDLTEILDHADLQLVGREIHLRKNLSAEDFQLNPPVTSRTVLAVGPYVPFGDSNERIEFYTLMNDGFADLVISTRPRFDALLKALAKGELVTRKFFF